MFQEISPFISKGHDFTVGTAEAPEKRATQFRKLSQREWKPQTHQKRENASLE